MKLLQTDIKKEVIDQFIAAIDTFPVSPVTSTVQYDTAKLIDILRIKEITDVCGATEADFGLVNDIDIEFGKVVRDLVFEKHPEESIDEYHRLEKKLEKTIPSKLYVYSRQAALSVKSLYYYKQGEWDKAVAVTLECIALNDYLVQMGMHTLNLRIFEQNKNISRIYFRAGKSKQAHELLFNLFNYMLNGVNNNLYGSIFGHEEYFGKSPLIRETFSYEMFVMIVEDMIKFNLDNQQDYLPNNWYKNLDFEVDNANRQVIYNWIYINNQLRKEKFEDFFDSLIYYFNQPISQYYDILKIAVLMDVCKLIRKSNYGNKEYAIEKIRFFIQDKIKTFDRLRGKILSQYFSVTAQVAK